jgi:nucleoside-diphosphate-sugar epimerase
MVYLVTGGAGFIGSHVVEALYRRGERVRVLDNLATGSLRNLEDALGLGRGSLGLPPPADRGRGRQVRVRAGRHP